MNFNLLLFLPPLFFSFKKKKKIENVIFQAVQRLILLIRTYKTEIEMVLLSNSSQMFKFLFCLNSAMDIASLIKDLKFITNNYILND